MIDHCEGLLLRLLVRLTGARRILELGTFTGYSALTMAEGLPEDGELITCDLDPEVTKIAQRYWSQSSDGSKIKLVLGPALDTIETIQPPLDLIFLDADKENYVNYWEACLPKLRAGGVLVVDNVLWSGRVLDPKEPDDHAIAAFNEHVAGDDRVEFVILAIRDGVLVAIKR
jgi:caffeoyl-CoA O-methyltransferase